MRTPIPNLLLGWSAPLLLGAVACPLAAQTASPRSVKVSWPSTEFVVAADTEAGLTFYALAEITLPDGSRGRHLDRIAVDPVTALQWTVLMRRLLDSTHRVGPTVSNDLRVLAPTLEDSCGHHWLGIGVDGSSEYTLVLGDSTARATWRTSGPRKAVNHLFDAVTAMAPLSMLKSCYQRAIVIRYPTLTYPTKPIKRAMGGRVEAEMTVDTMGRPLPESIQILSATDTVFVPSAKVWFAQLRFLPALMQGQPVKSQVRYTLHFGVKGDMIPGGLWIAP